MLTHIFLAPLAVSGVAAPAAADDRPAAVSDHGPMPGTAGWGRDLPRHQTPLPGRAVWDGDPLMGNWSAGPPFGGFGLGWLWPGWQR